MHTIRNPMFEPLLYSSFLQRNIFHTCCLQRKLHGDNSNLCMRCVLPQQPCSVDMYDILSQKPLFHRMKQYWQAVLRRRHAYGPSAALLVASDEILPLESAERYPAPSQKLPTSKQSTSPAAPTLAPPLLSASIAPNPLFFESASHQLTLTNRRFEFSCRQDNRGKGAAAEGPQTRACLSAARRF